MATRGGIALSTVVIAAALAAALPAHAGSTAGAPEVASATAPAAFAVRFETTKGGFVVEAYRSWAPQAVDRFYNLVRSGYLDGNLFFRIVAGNGVDFGINGDPKTRKAWGKSPIPCDPPKRGIRAGDVFLLNNGLGEGAATEIRIQTGPDADMSSRSGTTALGRVVEGIEVLASLDASHMQDTRKWNKMIRALLDDGDAKVRKDYPKMDSIVRATLLERIIELPAEEPAPAAAAAIPPGMALVRVYRDDTSIRKFTLRIDGTARAVLAKSSFFETALPAGRHELSTKVKFKMFATGLGDKLFAARDTLAVELAPGGVYHVRAVTVGQGQTLQLYLVANDFGAEECKALAPAKPPDGTEED
jgi:cyclophilin family peptidyl-prolyl cis-trans isomerase